MAFYYAADTTELLPSLGQYPQIVVGSVVLSGGTITVTVPNFSIVKGAIASSQTANAARVSAVSSNTFTITGNGSDRVDFMVWGKLRG